MLGGLEPEDCGISLGGAGNRTHEIPVQMARRRSGQRRNFVHPCFVFGVLIAANAVDDDNGGARVGGSLVHVRDSSYPPAFVTSCAFAWLSISAPYAGTTW